MAGVGDIPLPTKTKTKDDKVLSPSKIPLPPSSSIQGDIKDPKFAPPPPPPEAVETAASTSEKTESKSKPITLVRNRFLSYKKQIVSKKKNENETSKEKVSEPDDKSKVVDDLFKEFMSQKLSDAEKTHRANIISRLQKKQEEAKSKQKQVEEEMARLSQKYKEDKTATVPKVSSTVSKSDTNNVEGPKKVPKVLQNIKMSYDDDEEEEIEATKVKTVVKELDKSKRKHEKKHKKHKHKHDKTKSEKSDKGKADKSKEKIEETVKDPKHKKDSSSKVEIPEDTERKVESQSGDIKVTISSEKENNNDNSSSGIDNTNGESVSTVTKSDSRTIQIIPRSVQERVKKDSSLKLVASSISSVERNNEDSSSGDKLLTKGDKDSSLSDIPIKAIVSSGDEQKGKGDGEQNGVKKTEKNGGVRLGLGLKISSSSASLISSGVKVENNPLKKNLEDGELTPEISDSSSSSDSEINNESETGEISDDEDKKSKKKKKKKKKGKKKKKKHKKESKKKKRSRSQSLSPRSSKRSRSRSRSRTPKKLKNGSRSPSRSSMSFDKKLGVWVAKSRSRSRSRDRRGKRDSSRERSSRMRRGSVERGRGRSREKYYDRHRRDSSRDRYERSRGRSRSRSRHRSREKDRHRGHSRDRSHDKKKSKSRSKSPPKPADYVPTWSDRARDAKLHKIDREKEKYEKERERMYRRSRSRSRSKTPEDLRLKIDKAKLRQIAIKNAMINMRSGGPAVNINSSELTAMRAGGKSVEELTDYCKSIAEKDGQVSSSEEEGETKSDGEVEVFTHPFQLKDIRDPQASIVMNIRNAKPLPLLTPVEKAQKAGVLRTQFPVSSGSVHRAKEGEWVEVEKTPAGPGNKHMLVSVPVPASSNTSKAEVPSTSSATGSSDTATVKPAQSVFPEIPQKNLDIGSLVSERLSAMRQLNQNPNDSQAISKLYKVNKEMDFWARSKEVPGQYYGSTGAKVMSQEELGAGYQAWAKKDQFHNASAVRSGIGMLLLQKMGWKQGQGLGKDNEGNLEPLTLDVKMDRKGLQSQGEVTKKVSQVKMAKNMSHKHPVSALTELCIKKKWGHPNFTLVHESGPDHKKNFLFKATVNNLSYQPSIASNNKKQAKAQAAQVALQELGLLPRDMAPF